MESVDLKIPLHFQTHMISIRCACILVVLLLKSKSDQRSLVLHNSFSHIVDKF